MIRYSLACAQGHVFEAWFASSAAYDEQAKKETILCPDCGSSEVSKAPMAPNVVTHRAARIERGPARAAAEAVKPQMEMLALMRGLRAHVEANADYVGKQFPEEARKIHYEEVPARSIYGEASREEAEELREEGVPVYPLPILPEDHN